MDEQNTQSANGKIYLIQGQVLHLREKATFAQVQLTTKMVSSLEIDEKTSILQAISKVGEKIIDFMCIVFDKDAETARSINWAEVTFDEVAEIFTDFLSSSTLLRSVVRS